MSVRKIWNIHESQKEIQEKLIQGLNISPTLSMLLVNRGYDNIKEAEEYLDPKLELLSSPSELANLDQAIEKIKLALKKGQKIVIYGDYDVDGITSTALLIETFKIIGYQVDYYIPDRTDEGYGLNIEALNNLAQQGTQLIITVDCGISSKKEVSLGKQLGLDFIITDHHQPSPELPDGLIINPHLEEGGSPWKNLAGVGVAFKLAQGLLKAFLGKDLDKELFKLLDLVALGTIADIVPLVGENRILVKYGLEEIIQGKRVGLKALCDNANLDINKVTSTSVGYILAPRINACGRIGDPSLGVKLLLTSCEKEAQEIALHLNSENQLRQSIESNILQQAMEMLVDLDLKKTGVIVLYGQDWHQGVIGIVASRLVEKYYRPVIILSKKNNLYKGSGRSIPGFHLYQALTTCEELLESFGGHSQAAGLSLKEDNMMLFIDKINEIALGILTEKDFVPTLKIDGEIDLEQVDFELLDEIEKLEPFGCANAEPVLVYRQGEINEYKEVGSNGGHLKINLKAGNLLWDGIGFNMANYLELVASKDPIDLAFTLDKNTWNGRTKLQLILKDLKFYTQPDNPYIRQSPAHNCPDRDQLVQFYILLKKMAEKEKTFIFGQKQLAKAINTGKIINTMDLKSIEMWLDIFAELDLLTYEVQGEDLKVLFDPSPKRVNLEDSPKYLQSVDTRNKYLK